MAKFQNLEDVLREIGSWRLKIRLDKLGNTILIQQNEVIGLKRWGTIDALLHYFPLWTWMKVQNLK